MRFTQALALAAFAVGAHAHSTMFSVWVNDVDQGDGRSVYIRSPPNNNPVKDLTSADLVCNVNGGTAVSKFVSVAAGDKLTFEWFHDSRGDDIIASSHKGPIITYVAPYTETNGASAIWTKIAEEGFDGTSWAVDKLIANKGKKDFTLPASLAAGKYLVRQEIIALHEADTTYNTNSARGAQFYPSCVQVDVSSSGSAVPDQDFDFNTGYTYANAGIHFSLYDAFTSYPIPGPSVWSAQSTSSASASTKATTTKAATTPEAAPTKATSVATSVAAAATTTTSPAAVTPTTRASASSPAKASTTSVKASSVPATAPTLTRAVSTAKATPTTLATVRRSTTSKITTKAQTTAAPSLAAADCTVHTRTVTVQARPGQPGQPGHF